MHGIGDRLRAWREHSELSQKDASTRLGVPSRTFQNYEIGLRSPGAEAMEAFARAGINTNWLLTGEGPMLLAELDEVATLRALNQSLQAERDALAARLAQAQGAPLNQPALRAIIAGTVEAQASGAPADVIARLAVDYYCRAIADGMITADGIGDGNLKKAG